MIKITVPALYSGIAQMPIPALSSCKTLTPVQALYADMAQMSVSTLYSGMIKILESALYSVWCRCQCQYGTELIALIPEPAQSKNNPVSARYIFRYWHRY
jgi:hypothetical protein